jgi:hypothetical protein
VEIDCSLSGDAELAADATVKFRDAKKRAVAAITGMKNADVTVTSEGISIGSMMDPNTQMMINRGQSVAAVKPRVQVVEKEKIILANVEKMEPEALLDLVLKVLDVAKDAGFTVGQATQQEYYSHGYRQQSGQGSVVSFKLPDATALRDRAYKQALEEAKTKAAKLAELSGVKLGPVVSIQESGSSRGQRYNSDGSLIDDKGISGATTAELSISVNLSVKFEIAK